MSESPKDVILSEGRSNAYLIHGCVVVLLAVALAFVMASPHYLIFAIASIIPFSASTGVQIDISNKRVRKYSSFLSYKMGIWLPTSIFVEVELCESTVSYASQSFFRYAKSTSRTFDVVLTTKSSERYELNDFFQYHKALKCIEVLEHDLGLKAFDRYAAETSRLQKLRKVRR